MLRNWQEWLCHKRPSRIGVSLSWKIEYPDVCITATRHVVRKVSLYGWETISPWECNFWTGRLTYDIISSLLQTRDLYLILHFLATYAIFICYSWKVLLTLLLIFPLLLLQSRLFLTTCYILLELYSFLLPIVTW